MQLKNVFTLKLKALKNYKKIVCGNKVEESYNKLNIARS